MYIIFDIGGTKTRFAYSSDGESFSDPHVIKTPKNYDEGIKAISDAFTKVSGGQEIKRSAGGIRGVLDRSSGVLMKDAVLTEWLGKPLRENLQNLMGAEVFLENDTAMVGLGEAVKGAGRGSGIVVYLTISTGIGGARIVNQSIDISVYNAEPGHQIIDADASICEDCGTELDQSGGFEVLVSGTAFEKRFGKKPYDTDSEDPVWVELSRLVAVGINNTVVHWSPDVVVLGGGMMRSPGIKVDMVEGELKKILKIYPKHPILKKAELGDFGGLYGALHYLKTHI